MYTLLSPPANSWPGGTIPLVRRISARASTRVASELRTNTSRRRSFQQNYVQALARANLIPVREPSDIW